VDFLISNQNVRDPFQLDWSKVIKSASFVYSTWFFYQFIAPFLFLLTG
jgi:hypothetical protein